MYPYLNNFKFSDFILFGGQEIISAIECIARFIYQCKEVADYDLLKLDYFQIHSLEIYLPSNSVHNWNEMQNIFQAYFSRTKP
jgi:hypothetical protein